MVICMYLVSLVDTTNPSIGDHPMWKKLLTPVLTAVFVACSAKDDKFARASVCVV